MQLEGIASGRPVDDFEPPARPRARQLIGPKYLILRKQHGSSGMRFPEEEKIEQAKAAAMAGSNCLLPTESEALKD